MLSGACPGTSLLGTCPGGPETGPGGGPGGPWPEPPGPMQSGGHCEPNSSWNWFGSMMASGCLSGMPLRKAGHHEDPPVALAEGSEGSDHPRSEGEWCKARIAGFSRSIYTMALEEDSGVGRVSQ